MKTHFPSKALAWILPLALAFAFVQAARPVALAAFPKITTVRMDDQNVVVGVSVPVGVRRVTLEARARLGKGTWVPKAVSRLDGQGGDRSFSLPKSAEAEILRVRADDQEPLPASFYSGTNSFISGTSAANGGNMLPVADAGVSEGSKSNGSGGDTSRAVTESDIWKISENTLYFFNQYRGLQIIDLTTPDAPVITGTYPLPNAGEQMYVLPGNYVVLLVQDNCSSATGGGSQALVLDVSGGVPKPVANLPVPGWIQESRMVGSALYVASQSYRPVAGSKESSGAWEWGSVVSSFDLGAPAVAAVKDTLWYPGYGNVINATDQFLFVATQNPGNWWQSIVRIIDISAPDGAMKALGSVTVSGNVPDKFKINQNSDVLTVISENWNTDGRGVMTVLETFSLAEPAAPAKLGRLQFPQRERLHATRFDGSRVYVVTFFQIDPLWIVDLTDPKSPQVAGQLEVPGWSTYIQPLGDRLVAIGINDTNDWRVAVSLFDVRDPAKPALLGKVPLGVNYSWSEANNDEKAFAVLPDDGLILVPYQGYETNGTASRVQLIDLHTDSLQARGTIEYSFQPRRATLRNQRIYSVSGKQLLTVDAANRDKPEVRSDLELSWSVDRVFVSGAYVMEIANGNNWSGWWSQGSATPPSVRVAKTSDPERALNIFVLKNDLPVLGATLQDGKLYLAQGDYAGGIALAAADGSGTGMAEVKSPSLFLSVVDLNQLPALSLSGQATAVTEPLYWNASLEALWPQPGLLVWAGGGGGWGPWLYARGGADLVVGKGIWGGGWGSTGGRFFAFDVSQATAPAFASEVNLTTNSWWSFSSAYTANGLVYVSHQTSEFAEGVTLPDQPAPVPVITVDKETGQTVTNVPPVGVWVQRYFLDVVDYGDATSPTLRKPVNIPGQLNGLGHAGALLYTLAPHWKNWVTDWAEWLDASAYDGVSASLVSSLPMPSDWPHPLLVRDDQVFLARPNGTTGTSQLETWALADTGKFAKTGAIGIGAAVNSLTAFGNLLVGQLGDGTVLLLDATTPVAPVPVGKGQAGNCLWFDLTHAQGSLEQGLWLPLGDFGLSSIPVRR